MLAGVSEAVRKELDTAGVTGAIVEDAYYASIADVLKAYSSRG